eukprot:scaffold116292_cov29-Tisochrysis_lutea.AAC.6
MIGSGAHAIETTRNLSEGASNAHARPTRKDGQNSLPKDGCSTSSIDGAPTALLEWGQYDTSEREALPLMAEAALGVLVLNARSPAMEWIWLTKVSLVIREMRCERAIWATGVLMAPNSPCDPFGKPRRQPE